MVVVQRAVLVLTIPGGLLILLLYPPHYKILLYNIMPTYTYLEYTVHSSVVYMCSLHEEHPTHQ